VLDNFVAKFNSDEVAGLAKVKAYFGHQSVGQNIVDGMLDLQKRYPELVWRVLDSTEGAPLGTGYMVHSRIGKNSNPISKLNDFVVGCDTDFVAKYNMSLFKLCYVDIRASTDIELYFNQYVAVMERMQACYPEHVFLHATVPLTVTKVNVKTAIKQILRVNKIWELDDNVRRNQLNAMLRKHYTASGLLFDIAALETRGAECGKPEGFYRAGQRYDSMSRNLSDDGGHLNSYGSVLIARDLLSFMAAVANRKLN
jgi:hypothetical protein